MGKVINSYRRGRDGHEPLPNASGPARLAHRIGRQAFLGVQRERQAFFVEWRRASLSEALNISVGANQTALSLIAGTEDLLNTANPTNQNIQTTVFRGDATGGRVWSGLAHLRGRSGIEQESTIPAATLLDRLGSIQLADGSAIEAHELEIASEAPVDAENRIGAARTTIRINPQNFNPHGNRNLNPHENRPTQLEIGLDEHGQITHANRGLNGGLPVGISPDSLQSFMTSTLTNLNQTLTAYHQTSS